jgi:hypothetical protein
MIPYLRTAEIERQVRSIWLRHGLAVRFDVERLIDLLDLGLLWTPLEPQDGLTVAAELVPGLRKVLINEDLLGLFVRNPPLLNFTLAHEVAHWLLHVDAIETGVVGQRQASPGWLVCRSSDLTTPLGRAGALRLEYQANLFASHLLAPDAVLLEALERIGCEGWGPVRRMARAIGLSPTALFVRLRLEGHAYADEHGVPHPGRPAPESQISLGL